MPAADIEIGGIALGATESYVRRIHGEPDEISYESNRRRTGPINQRILRYENSFFIVFDADDNSNAAWEAKSTDDLPSLPLVTTNNRLTLLLGVGDADLPSLSLVAPA